MPPDDESRLYAFAQFRENEVMVRDAVADLASRTSLSFDMQTGYCDQTEEALNQPMMRLEMQTFRRTGYAHFLNEDFLRDRRNIELPFLNHSNGSEAAGT